MKDLVACMILLGLCGCAGAPQEGTALVRDSAGVTIVESSAPEWLDGKAWRLGEQPVVDIGGVDQDPNNELFRVVSAIRLKDGRILIANAGTHELRFYTPEGRLISSAGGQGSGPGEFERLLWVRRFKTDSLLTFDIQQQRTSIFDTDGRFIRSIKFETTAGAVSPNGPFADGSFLASRVYQPSLDSVRAGLRRWSFAFFHYAADGATGDSIDTYSGFETYLEPLGDGRLQSRTPPIQRSTYFLVHGDRYYVADNERYIINVHAPDGRLVRSVRRRHDPVAVTQQHIERLLAKSLENVTDDNRRRSIQRFFNAVPMPAAFPAYSSVQVDDAENLWVRAYAIPGANNLPSWTVFDSSGRMLGDVITPQRFEPLHIGADFVLGTWRDALDVEHVQLYELITS